MSAISNITEMVDLTITVKTSISTAIGISFAFCTVYLSVCIFCIVARVKQGDPMARMSNPDGRLDVSQHRVSELTRVQSFIEGQGSGLVHTDISLGPSTHSGGFISPNCHEGGERSMRTNPAMRSSSSHSGNAAVGGRPGEHMSGGF
ncbi:uncharacterized protein LOC135808659 [Sycon ciliatum]|uniref:uncharacterized protein LOC135808659 n=1 Tax=Sycon ciliatum TaxID=27933 RepID=UPI0020ACEFA4|eukprot:scpid89703/ scgid33152/ 